ncbi:hypothetical protein [Arthrobacter sp. AFG20]|uniref:hypothetical protein n=1 Tax=Arthrobacter sp. AFG20 TaxID=1688671 RepID=UPI000C9DE79C|nr:hypothetical protein [Arthrobacter sp. AFG20]PNH86124.1 hypothetical protein CXZ05_03210 [Arthrobacter sp. AFG20]
MKSVISLAMVLSAVSFAGTTPGSVQATEVSSNGGVVALQGAYINETGHAAGVGESITGGGKKWGLINDSPSSEGRKWT